mmetsp:Transcript_42966/g.134237  ORF Transcript_42966/g.134237 Transcript_42966/m.134237 type:complete len:347 (-) Transcript_42966:350-1390(-)
MSPASPGPCAVRARRALAAAPWRQAAQPRGAHRSPTSPGAASSKLLSPDELDESLAQAASSLEISCEAGMNASTGKASSCGRCSLPSSSWSPASVSGSRARRRSTRRSLSELSESARMTPQELKNRGLGIPWQRHPGICTLDLHKDEAAEQARQFCLMPTPELHKRRVSSPLQTPEHSSPRAMQRLFTDRVRRASLSQSSGSAKASFSPEEASLSPIGAASESSPLEEAQRLPPPPRRPVRARSLFSMPMVTAGSPPQMHTARRAEERLQLPVRVQPQILKSRRLTNLRQPVATRLAAQMGGASTSRLAAAGREIPPSWKRALGGPRAVALSKENAQPPNSAIHGQ